MLPSDTHFTAKVNELMAAQFGIDPSRLTTWSNGMAAASSELVELMKRDKQYKKGFGVVSFAGLYQANPAEIQAAMQRAPQLLAKDGLAVLSDPEAYRGMTCSVWEILDFAQAAFGKEPEAVVRMELEATSGNPAATGIQAVFRK